MARASQVYNLVDLFKTLALSADLIFPSPSHLFLPSQVIRGARRPLRPSPLGAVVWASVSDRCLPPRFQGPSGRLSQEAPGRNAQDRLQPREKAGSAPRSRLALAKDIPSPCFLLHWNKHRICCTGLWGAGRGRPRRPCLQFTQHPPEL